MGTKKSAKSIVQSLVSVINHQIDSIIPPEIEALKKRNIEVKKLSSIFNMRKRAVNLKNIKMFKIRLKRNQSRRFLRAPTLKPSFPTWTLNCNKMIQTLMMISQFWYKIYRNKRLISLIFCNVIKTYLISRTLRWSVLPKKSQILHKKSKICLSNKNLSGNRNQISLGNSISKIK